MAENSKIAWTDHSFNPWVGCMKISPGCTNCYAATLMDTRYHKVQWGARGTRVRMSASYWRTPLKWNEHVWRECLDCGFRGKVGPDEPYYLCRCENRNNKPTRQRVFCASLADVFENKEETRNWLWDLGELIEQTPNLDWLLLTKRPENVIRLIEECMGGRIGELWLSDHPNIWIGTSVENQEYANERIPELLKVPAKIKFLSVEPMLGPVDLVEAVNKLDWMDPANLRPNGIDWVICGGESGSGARIMELEWARDLRDQCRGSDVPFFMKQRSGLKPGDYESLPDDLKVREWPVEVER